MNIRKADEKDIPTCVKLSKIPEFALPGPCYPGEKYFQDALSSGIFFVAEEENQVVGLVLGFQHTTEEAFLDLLTVDKDFRDLKIGNELVKSFTSELKKRKVAFFTLIAPSDKPKTLN